MASLVVNTFPPKSFWKFCITRYCMLGETAATCSDVLFQIHRCPWFLFVHLALEISSEEEVLRLWTLVPMNIEVPTNYPLSQDRIVVLEIRLHSKSSTDQRSMATEMLRVRLEERSRTNYPRQRFTHSCVAKSSGISAGPCILSCIL